MIPDSVPHTPRSMSSRKRQQKRPRKPLWKYGKWPRLHVLRLLLLKYKQLSLYHLPLLHHLLHKFHHRRQLLFSHLLQHRHQPLVLHKRHRSSSSSSSSNPRPQHRLLHLRLAPHLRDKSKRPHHSSLKHPSNSNSNNNHRLARQRRPRKPRIPQWQIRLVRHKTSKLLHCPINHREVLLLRES